MNIAPSMASLFATIGLAAATSLWACEDKASKEADTEVGPVATDRSIEMDPAICAEGDAGVAMGLGSASLHVRGLEKEGCLFEYFFEIEGGYSRYLCHADPFGSPVTVKVTGSARLATSFDVDSCELLQKGNLLLEMRKPSDRADNTADDNG